MLREVFQVEWFVAGRARDLVDVEHFENQGRGYAIATIDTLADQALFLFLLQVLVVHFHVQAVGAV